MKLGDKQRELLIYDLTTNCDCWKHPGDKEVLNGFTDAKLLQLKEAAAKEQDNAAVANAAREGFQEGNKVHKYDAARKQFVTNAVADPDDDDDDDDEKGKGKTMEKPNCNQLTDDQWLAQQPPGIQSAVRTALKVEKREKQRLVQRLTANLAEDKRARATERWMGKSLSELEEMAELVPAPVSRRPVTNEGGDEEEDSDRGVPLFFGGGGGPVGNADDDNDYLPLPVTDYTENASKKVKAG